MFVRCEDLLCSLLSCYQIRGGGFYLCGQRNHFTPTVGSIWPVLPALHVRGRTNGKGLMAMFLDVDSKSCSSTFETRTDRRVAEVAQATC